MEVFNKAYIIFTARNLWAKECFPYFLILYGEFHDFGLEFVFFDVDGEVPLKRMLTKKLILIMKDMGASHDFILNPVVIHKFGVHIRI